MTMLNALGSIGRVLPVMMFVFFGVLAAPARKICTLCSLALVAWLGAVPAVAQETLGVGDRLQLSILGVPQSGGPVTISADGTAALPYIGTVEAAGKSVAMLSEEIEIGLISRNVTIVQPDGGTLVVALSGADFFLQLVEKAPVIVDGFVTEPGAVPFQPRLTPRQAIALAGGLGTSQLGSSISPIQLLQINVSLGEARTDLARSTTELWMAEAMLARDRDLAAPEPPETVSPQIFSSLLDAARAQVEEQLNSLKAEIDFQTERSAVIASRLQILEEQIEVATLQRDQSAEESARLAEIGERGLVPLQRVQAEQRALSNASATLLDAEEAFTNAQLQRLDSERLIKEAEETLTETALERRALALANLAANRQEVDALTSLAVAAGLAESNGALGFVPNVVVYRDGEIVAEGESAIDFQLKSGDYVSVSFGGAVE